MSFKTAIVYYKNKKDLGVFLLFSSVFDVCWQWNLPAAEAAEAAATAETAATAATAAEAEAAATCQGLVGCH